MRMDFGSMEEVTIPHMNGGEGSIIARMYNDDHSRIIYTRIPAGSSIGIHRQESGDDINYVLEGKGMAVCDGQEEPLFPGVCHICPKGSSHTIVNDGDSDLVLFTVVNKH
ncbi:MAG: cupin domain-containing protein [Candidatus Methanomethylophilus sp.]|nr:cupin domain-containing protein [Methanomethylophilus sp.]MBQ5397372.1 cupin domain-containing protein [Methanomethylophilus sp.]